MKLGSLRRLPAWLRISPWIVIALAVILTGLVIAFSEHSTGKAREFAARLTLEKGASVIRGFEAAVNASLGMRWTEDELARLIEEMGDQPDIDYLAVTDQNGLVLASSKPDMSDKDLLDAKTFASMRPSDKPGQIRLQEPGNSAFFLVYKEFKLRDRPRRPRRHHMNPGMPPGPPKHSMNGPGSPQMMPSGSDMPFPPHGRQCRWLPPENKPGGAKRIIIVGYDTTALEKALAVDKNHLILMSWIIFLLGFAGLLSLFLAHSYTHSRRLLQDMRAFSNEVSDSLPVGVISADAKGHVTYANPEALRIAGISAASAIGRSPALLLPQAWEHIASSLAEGHNVAEYETWLVGGSGKRIPVALAASRIVTEEGGHVADAVIMRDLGEVKKLQSEVRRRDRLVSLGNMAAGIAHELRNPLSSIKGLARFFMEQSRENSSVVKAGEVMTQEIDRLDRVVGGLLDLARPDQLVLGSTSLQELVERARRLAEPDLQGRNIIFETDLAAYPHQVLLDGDRMIQALLNLFLNAVQAMEGGGRLLVRAAEDGDNLLLEISDTGCGIPEEQIGQLFSPYFTTKASGAGLGLALVHKIVEAHDGGIEVKSRVGQGTVFTIRLPQAGI